MAGGPQILWEEVVSILRKKSYIQRVVTCIDFLEFLDFVAFLNNHDSHDSHDSQIRDVAFLNSRIREDGGTPTPRSDKSAARSQRSELRAAGN